MSVPPVGTRPRIEGDWKDIVTKARGAGIELSEFQRSYVPYDTPPFERNALRAAGVTRFPSRWRRGDLAVFQISQQSPSRVVEIYGGQSTDSGQGIATERWDDFSLRGVRIKVRQAGVPAGTGNHGAEPVFPGLISLLPGDVFPTVSRRDNRRDTVDVWTSGNRVYGCRSPRYLGIIMSAMREGKDPIGLVSHAIGRDLRDDERNRIHEARQQIADVVEKECLEYLGHKSK